MDGPWSWTAVWGLTVGAGEVGWDGQTRAKGEKLAKVK